ncbi:MAG: antibiotic biosynthesis monooxygenase family protein [Burkholderiales bacterium]
MYVITVEFVIRAPHAAAFQAAVMENAARSLEWEPACRHFDVCTSLGDGPTAARTVFLYELYDDRAGFEAHLDADHFKAFDAHVAPWVERKIVRGWQLA